jgi:hypothetical protein
MREERKNEAHSEIGCADTFDGPDAEQLKLAQLAEIWTKLVFAPHPTALRLTFATNAPDIWSALRGRSAPRHPRMLPEPQATLVWRRM